MEKSEFKMVREVAEAEFDNWAEAMMLDLDTADMDAEDLTAHKKIKKRLTSCLMNGSLLTNDEGLFVYTAQHSDSIHKEPITFYEVTGAALMDMDGKTKNQDVRKMYAATAAACKVRPKDIAGMVGIDAKVVREIFTLLMD